MKALLDAFLETAQALVRPAVTLTFSGAMVWGWYHGRLSDDAFLGVASMVIGFWFQQRTGKADAPPPANGAVVGPQ